MSPRRSLGAGFGEKGIDFVFVKEVSGFAVGVLKQGRDGLKVDIVG
jgi:hypothetical protein